MDNSFTPANDFYKYVNGKWLDNTEMQDNRTRCGSFDELRKKTDDDVLSILNTAMSNNKISIKLKSFLDQIKKR